MLNIEGKKIYLACGITDLRKAINALSPFDKAIFIFCNRSRNLIKILEWDEDGFWLHCKRLDKGKFKWPTKEEELTIELSYEELNCFLGVAKIERKIKRIESNKIKTFKSIDF